MIYHWINWLSLSQIKKNTGSHLSPSKESPKHQLFTTWTFLIANAIRVKLLFWFSLYLILKHLLHTFFHIHFICKNIWLSIFNRKMSVFSCKLQITLSILFYKIGPSSCYAMPIAQILEGKLNCRFTDLNLKIMNNWLS